MKNINFLFIAMILITTSVKAELLEMAANCDDATKELTEILKHPDAKTAERIRDMLGVDIFNSCSVPDGKIICFQCLDRNQQLNLIQLHENKVKEIFELKGLGCKCDQTK